MAVVEAVTAMGAVATDEAMAPTAVFLPSSSAAAMPVGAMVGTVEVAVVAASVVMAVNKREESEREGEKCCDATKRGTCGNEHNATERERKEKVELSATERERNVL